MYFSFDPRAGLKALKINRCALAAMPALAVLTFTALAWSPQLRAASDSDPLSLEDAVDQALKETPQVAASVATLEAAQAVLPSAGRLPDPELVAAVDNLPINTTDRFFVDPRLHDDASDRAHAKLSQSAETALAD